MVIDCRGVHCPQPVLLTRDALDTTTDPVIEVVVDNEASRSNVERFAHSQGHAVTVASENETWRLTITRQEGAVADPDAPAVEDYLCEFPEGGEVIYIIPSNTMGTGDDELGWGLLQTYIQTIKEVSPKPSKVFFYNSGVLLTSRETGILPYIQELERSGVKIYSCGTCVDFFNKSDKILVGKSTNMLEIMESQAKATKVLSPF